MELPRCTKSRTDKLEPSRENERIESAEPTDGADATATCVPRSATSHDLLHELAGTLLRDKWDDTKAPSIAVGERR